MSGMGDVWRQLLGIAIGGAYAFSTSCATAQITPDRTLPNNSSVTINGSVFNITGGTQAGRNLFHSFSQFSVPTGGTASFINGADIQNIISRVTGGSGSSIDGLIKASGTANLFFLNPNGIVFGKNASLNIGGSFVTTTANAIQFGNLGTFSATVPNNPALLTVNPSALFYNQIAAGAYIQNSSQATQATVNGNVVGLQVPDGKSLLLVGGNVNLDGGALTANSGRVELASLAAPGTVDLTVAGNSLSLSVPSSVQRGDISLNAASVNVTGNGSGSVAVTGHNIDILGGSRISAGIGQGLTAVGSSPGDIDINATGAVTINQASRLSNQVAMSATGNAGNINLKAGEISITNQDSSITNGLDAALITEPKGIGRAGDISLESNGSITLIGQSLNPEDKVISTFSQSRGLGAGNISLIAKGSISLDNAFLVSSSFGADSGKISLQGDESISMVDNSSLVVTNFSVLGNSGNITLQSNGPISLRTSMVSNNIGTTELGTDPVQGNGGLIKITGQSVYVTEGALVTASSFTSGNAGNIQINAKELVELSGMGQPPPPVGSRLQTYIYSSLRTSAEQEAKGSGGTISITTNTLKLSDGANIRADSKSTFPGSNGGSISINANVIDLTGGGQIFTTASNVGNAGNITLKATDRITISGTNPSFADTLNQALAGGYDIGSIDSASGIFANTSGTSIGNGGNLSITTGQLFVRDGAKVTASSLGSGNAGNLQVGANLINLNQGQLTAESISGLGGNIALQVNDILLMQHSSLISNTSGTAQKSGNEGNFTLHTKFLVAPVLENSDIFTDAFNGRGGKIYISASEGVFGFVVRSQQDLETLLGTSDPNKLDPQKLPTNDVSAISQNSPTIITPDIDPSRGLVNLPTMMEQPPKLISSSCATFNETAGGNNFTITGRGGLPSSPFDPLTSDVVWSDTRLPNTTQHQHKTHEAKPKPKPQPIAIVPATGWVFNDKGEVTLISRATNAASSNTPFSCPAR